jgi:hypothetical protein
MCCLAQLDLPQIEIGRDITAIHRLPPDWLGSAGRALLGKPAVAHDGDRCDGKMGSFHRRGVSTEGLDQR